MKNEDILKLWKDGKTGGEIAALTGLTRSAVMGRIARQRMLGKTDYKASVSIINLRLMSCKYIVSDEPTRYCGKTKTRGSYCTHHAELCYAAPYTKDQAIKGRLVWKSKQSLRSLSTNSFNG